MSRLRYIMYIFVGRGRKRQKRKCTKEWERHRKKESDRATSSIVFRCLWSYVQFAKSDTNRNLRSHSIQSCSWSSESDVLLVSLWFCPCLHTKGCQWQPLFHFVRPWQRDFNFFPFVMFTHKRLFMTALFPLCVAVAKGVESHLNYYNFPIWPTM